MRQVCAGLAESMSVIAGDGVTQSAGITMKPKLKKIGRLWVCYTEWDTLTCTGATPVQAYNRWRDKNKEASNDN